MHSTPMHVPSIFDAYDDLNIRNIPPLQVPSGGKQHQVLSSDTARRRSVQQQHHHPRVRFIRLSSLAKDKRSPTGLTPPYCPGGPTLLRTFDDCEKEAFGVSGVVRKKSPLQELVLSNYSISINKRLTRNTKMPHTGFQALILCGPGIGLSTFTSVPNEFPKALVEVANRPMVWYVLDWCYRMGVTDITLITPPNAKDCIAAALAQNPYLTSLPSPTPDLLAPGDLEFTTPTAELLRLQEVQEVIKQDFLLLPCDMICDISGDVFLESFLTRLGGFGGIGAPSDSDMDASKLGFNGIGGERSGRRGGLSIWYNTGNREESVKGEECDFMCTGKLDHRNELPVSKASHDKVTGVMRQLLWTMPMSELWDQCEEDKSWEIRQSLIRKHGNIKCLTRYRDSHIYLFPYWIKEFAKVNDEFESVSEDLVGTWAKSDWRKANYRERYGARTIFGEKHEISESQRPQGEIPIEEDIDLLSLSTTQISLSKPTKTNDSIPPKTAKLASRVQADPDSSILSQDNETEANDSLLTIKNTGPVPPMPPILSYILPSTPETPLLRRVDTTPLLLSVSLLLAKIPSIEESKALPPSSSTSNATSPFAHPSKVSPTATIAPRVTISRSDTLIDSNTSIATQCVIKSSVIGATVSIGQGTRITNCVIMDGATVGEKCVLTGTVIGKKARIDDKSTLNNCEVQDGNLVVQGTEGKGEKFLIGGLEDEVDGDDDMGFGDGTDDLDDDNGDEDDGDEETISLS